MNKQEFINELSSKINYSLDECTSIVNIFESNFFISQKGKENIIREIISDLNVDETEATDIYTAANSIIKNEVKNKLKHPFKNRKTNQ